MKTVFFELERACESSGRLGKLDCWETPPGVSDSVGLTQVVLRICVSDRFPGDADAAGLGSTLGDLPH